MAVSGISPSSQLPPQSAQSSQSDPQQLFSQLASAISSGNLTGAQQAYTQLTQSLGSNVNPNSPVGQALNQIGQELQSGSISGAQQALTSLQQQLQAGQTGQASKGHHHHGGGGHRGGSSPPPASSSDSSTSVPTSATTGTNVNVTA